MVSPKLLGFLLFDGVGGFTKDGESILEASSA